MRSIRTRLNFWVFALIAGIFFFVFLVARNIYQASFLQTKAVTEDIIRESLTQGWKAKVHSLAAMHADQLIQPIYARDLEAVRHLAIVAKKHGLVTAIFVIDDHGIILSDGTWQSLYLGQRFSRSLLPDRKKTLLVETHVRVGDHLIGKVIMQFNAHQTEQAITTLHTKTDGLFRQFQTENQTRLTLLFIASLLSGLAGVYLLSRSLSRPLVLLSQAIARLGRGEYTVPASLMRNDEFGELAKTLKRVAESLRQNTVSKTYLERVLASLPVGVAVTDHHGFILNANTSFRHLCELQAVSGRRLQEAIGVTPEVFRDIAELLSQGNPIRDKEVVLNLNGRLVDALISGVPVEDLLDGATLNYLFIIYDITERKDLERQLRHLATHDHLTGLPNRRYLFNRIEDELVAYRRDPTYPFWLVFVDVDRFKSINDTYGHQVGDEVLKIIAKRLITVSREHDLVARLSGDEFLVMLHEKIDRVQAVQIAQRFLDTLRKPLHIQQLELTVSVSVGLAHSEPQHRCADDIINEADTAMYHAKTHGKDQLITSFDRDGDNRKRLLKKDLPAAINAKHIVNYYQPIVDLHTERVIGFEALARWRHPQQGIIMPDRFIAAAEETGLILPLGEQVLQAACQQQHTWSQHASFAECFVSINVSAKQLFESDFFQIVERYLRECKTNPSRIVLEITESLAMREPEKTAKTLYNLRKLGLRLAIDEFGTGYSSFSHLSRFPFDILKVDRSFVAGIALSKEQSRMMRILYDIGHNLGMKIIVEGVETDSQVQAVIEAGMTICQGFAFSMPAPAEELDHWNGTCVGGAAVVNR